MFRTSSYTGELKSSAKGRMERMTLDKMRRGGLASRMEEYIKILTEGDVLQAYGISGSGMLKVVDGNYKRRKLNMTKDEILQEAKALHYTEKLAIAQSLIQLSRKELEQLTSQFQPRVATPGSQCKKTESPAPSSDNSSSSQTSELTFEEIVDRLRKLKCKKNKTMLNSIMAMHQFRGGISDGDANKIVQKMLLRKIINIDEKGNVTWR